MSILGRHPMWTWLEMSLPLIMPSLYSLRMHVLTKERVACHFHLALFSTLACERPARGNSGIACHCIYLIELIHVTNECAM